MNKHGLTKENLVATLPPALRTDPSVVALAEALGEVLAARPEEIDLLRIYPVIDRLDERLLDILAYDFKVDWWDANYSLEEKRRTLKDSWRVHKLLGTKAAVEMAISAIYPHTQVLEWFEYGGEPHHFRVVTTCQELAVKGTADLLRALEPVKRLSSWMDNIILKISGDPFRSGVQHNFYLRQLMLSIRFSYLRGVRIGPDGNRQGAVVRWDGSVDYNGEILFDQASTGIRLPAMRFCIRLRELRSRSVRWDGSVLYDGAIDFGQQIGSGGSPSFGVRLRAPHALAASVPELRLGGGIVHPSSARVSRSVFAAPCARHVGHIGGAVTMDNWRGMDGGLSFDGTYKFDAYIQKEEL